MSLWVCEFIVLFKFIVYPKSAIRDHFFHLYLMADFQLNQLLIFLQNALYPPPLSCENNASKAANSCCFQSYGFLFQSIFEKVSCILHHFTFLFWVPARNFSTPNYPLFVPKTHFLTNISPFSAMCFIAHKGFIYTIVVYFYAFRLAFCIKTHCIQHHFTLRLAPKRTAFSIKTHCVQRHIATRLAPKYTTFCCKSPQNRYQWRSV